MSKVSSPNQEPPIKKPNNMAAAQNGYQALDAGKAQELRDAANRMRVTSIEITTKAASGHPTSSCSAAEIMSCLFFNEMRYDISAPKHPSADRFVLSKGHACPILYAAWKEAGLLSRDDVMTLRKLDSDIEGHPTPRLNFIDVATGSLGQGLSCAAGMAYTGKYWDKAAYRVYCLIGDGESAEGSIWEAAAFASKYALDNLVAIIDVNRLGQTEQTALGHQLQVYADRMQAFGLAPTVYFYDIKNFNAIVVDGHDVEAVSRALHQARNTTGKPTAIIAKTFKGSGIPGVEDLDNFHGKAIGEKGIAEISARIKNQDSGTVRSYIQPLPNDAPQVQLNLGNIKLSEPPAYKLGEKVATRQAYGRALAKLGASSPHVVAFDADTKNSTFAELFKKDHPERFVECYIAEQNMVGVAVGAGTRHRTIPFCSTFAAFFTRAADQLRMAAVSMANVKCVGSHVGVSIGEDGPSQMGLEDISLFRSILGSTVFYPSDATATERAVELAANIDGICFIRTSRPAMQTIYTADSPLAVGKAQVVRESAKDVCVVVAAAVTLIEALNAADTLAAQGTNICVIDPFTIKPIDAQTIGAHVKRCGGRLITVEDHYPEGGVGEAVCAGLAELGQSATVYRRLAVRQLPRSGPPAALLDLFGISASHIVAAVNSFTAA